MSITATTNYGCDYLSMPSSQMKCSIKEPLVIRRPSTVMSGVKSFLNFNGAIGEVWEWISNFITQLTEHVSTYPYWD